MEAYFDFEKPINHLEQKLVELKEVQQEQGIDLTSEIVSLEKTITQLIQETYTGLTPWQKVQLSRHPNRPYTRDYLEALFPDFLELNGDRTYGQDHAIMAGVASWFDRSTDVIIIGHQKGRTTKQKQLRNFAMARPEGYRKAMRLMDLAERFRLPILTFIDTPGAYPDIAAEERGQAQAIAESICKMFSLTVPVITVVLGEGGSGGALAIGIANRVLMLQYSTYSVISPEGCASILWSDAKMAEKAAHSMKMTPSDVMNLQVVDEIIPEPIGGAHRNWDGTFSAVKKALIKNMDELTAHTSEKGASSKSKKKTTKKKVSAFERKLAGKNSKEALELKIDRINKFRTMGTLALGHTKDQPSQKNRK